MRVSMHVFFLKGNNLVFLCVPTIRWLEWHLEALLNNSLATVPVSVLAVVETHCYLPQRRRIATHGS